MFIIESRRYKMTRWHWKWLIVAMLFTGFFGAGFLTMHIRVRPDDE
jgi:hypothetical protein